MEIKWLGHASFLITNLSGKKLLIDPFDESVGYDIYEGSADIVTISHHHHDHDYVEAVKSDPVIIDKIGEFTEFGISIKGIPSFHDKNKGADRGKNIIFVFNIDGYKICHLGDLGYELTLDEVKTIGDVDVLFIPVGGKYTITSAEAANVAKSINSHFVIPMHYKTPDLNLPLSGVDEFINIMGDAENINSNSFVIDDVPEEFNLVKILDYK